MKLLARALLLLGLLFTTLAPILAAETPTAQEGVIQRKLGALKMIWTDVMREPAGTAHRKDLLAEFMDKSDDYLALIPKAHNTAGGVWTLRAIAACALGRERDGRVAGKAMLDLGMDKSDSELAQKALAYLKRKNWLSNRNAPAPSEGIVAQKTKDMADVDAQREFEAGRTYEKAGEDLEALERYRRAAEKGHALAQAYLGMMYSNGTGTSTNYPEAVRWFRKAAEQGFAPAESKLGYMLHEGLGVRQNDKEAVVLFEQAARQGWSPAQEHLGYCFEYGVGVTKDTKAAIYWYRKAAQDNNQAAKEALNRLGEQ